MTAYTVSVNNNQFNVNATGVGAQGTQGNSISNAYIDSNNDFIIEISNASGTVVQTINVGGGTIAGQLNEFDTTYLGSKTAAPTLDNSGNALLDGALFFNTTTNELGVYDLGTTTWEYPSLEAATSASNAATSENNAATSATNSATSETNAGNSETAAATSETNSATSEANSATSETNAATSATNAATSETNAATSETNAGNSETAAATSETNAATSATNAGNSETAAATSATNAATSETNAAASATSSATSATNAATSETNAATSEANSATSATNAATSETNAATSATNAATSETNAAASAASIDLNSIDINGGTIDGTVIGGSTAAAGSFTTGSFTGDVSFGYNDKALFGAGSDLKIYHDGNNSVIADTGLGALITYSSAFIIQQHGSNERMADFSQNGAVNLYYDGASKLTTTSTGVDVTGTITADGLDINAAAAAFRVRNSTAGNDFSFKTGAGPVSVVGSEENVSLGLMTNNTQRMLIDSGGNVGIGKVPVADALEVNGVVQASSGFTFGSTSSYLYEGAADAVVLRVGSDGPYAEFNDAGSGVLEIGNASGELALTASGTESMRIDGFGNVGIGTSTLNSNKAVIEGGSAGTHSSSLKLSTGNSASGLASDLAFYGPFVTPTADKLPRRTADITSGFSTGNWGNEYLAFGVGVGGTGNDAASLTTERMRIDGSGKVLVGRTTDYSDGTVGSPALQVNAVTGSHAGLAVIATATTSTAAVGFVNPNGSVGNISISGSTTSYNTSSDYRLKTDAQPLTGASARVQALNPVNFEWIASGDRVDGFLAHEAQAVVPESVTGTKDATCTEEYEVTPAVLDAAGNVVTEAVMGTRSVPKYQSIDQSKLVPLLTAALQEALTKIDDMETRLAALEGN
jgi:hypothetical protein